MNEKHYPLEDLKVLDLSRVLAGPFAGRMLADLGAEVVKVEPPDQDVTRLWGRKTGGISGYFNQQNAGKLNISINLRSEQGCELMKSLVKQADVLLENFRPGVMERLGISWAVLSMLNPRLIMLSISGFGQQGPESGRAAYAPIIHAEIGAISRQAEKSGSRPVEMCMSFADTNAGLHGLVGLLAALHLRTRTGTGQHLDISMVDAMLATDDLAHYYLDYGSAHDIPIQNGASEVWDVPGGSIILAGDFRYIWKTLANKYDLDDRTPDGAPLADKISNRRQCVADYLNSFESRQRLIAALDKANLAWGDVNTTADYLQNSPTIKHRRSLVDVDDGVGGTRQVYQSPYRFSDASSGVKGPAVLQGQHTQQILSTWLGMQEAQVKELIDAGVLIQAPSSADVSTGKRK